MEAVVATDIIVSLVITAVVFLVGVGIVCLFGWIFDLLFGRRVDAWRGRRGARPYRAKPEALRRDFVLACFWMELGGTIVLTTLFLWFHPTVFLSTGDGGVRTHDWSAQLFTTFLGLVIGGFSAFWGWLCMSVWRTTRERDIKQMPERREREQRELRRRT